MEIKKNHWHYELIESFGTVPSKNLCIYFWQAVGYCLLWIAGLGMALTIGFSMLMALTIPFSDSLNEFQYLGLILWIISGAFLLSDFWNSKIKPRLPNRNSKSKKEPSLVLAYLKAKKEKVCPIIEFVD